MHRALYTAGVKAARRECGHSGCVPSGPASLCHSQGWHPGPRTCRRQSEMSPRPPPLTRSLLTKDGWDQRPELSPLAAGPGVPACGFISARILVDPANAPGRAPRP
ncbi:hypothetical protein AAFF_G00003650 [Aldrovandia affinis]|uniref:Uncharacterized protein n=1 Tax=Aldrovandia affinis TaxID=143900 RepID=A0AAD7TF28_9TELE|nr:hypothetical protein AAFF_G00003650 [Aldrovandia affinis]